MADIRELGGYFPQDGQGRVVNPCRTSHIPTRWQQPLSRAVRYLRDLYPEDLHSVWVRGSLPRGLFQEGISDIDVFALLGGDRCRRWTLLPVPAQLGPYPLELGVHPHADDLSAEHPRLAMLLATQSLPLWGPDLRRGLPGYRPGPAMMLHYRWLEADWLAFQEAPRKDAGAVRSLCKVLLRSGFELVMERQGRFTPDLYWCWRGFAEAFPDREGAMRSVLECFVDPEAYSSKKSRQFATLVEFIVKSLRAEGYLSPAHARNC